MALDLPEKLLTLAAAATWDGGDGVVRVLRGALAEAAPFDLGDVAVLGPVGYRRWTLTDDDEPVAAEDLLGRVLAERVPLRIDDAAGLDPFPRTRALMERHGQRSLLALPLASAGGAEGAVVLSQRHGWAFVGASLHLLWPVAAMAGLALERAAALTGLRKELDGARADLAASRHELEAARKAAAEAVASDAAVLEARIQEAVATAEALRAEVARHRDDAWRLASERDAAASLARALEGRLAALEPRGAEPARPGGVPPAPEQGRPHRHRVAPGRPAGDATGPRAEAHGEPKGTPPPGTEGPESGS